MKFLIVAGARPNFMKVAPILAAFAVHPEAEVLLVHTGQHYDAKMSGDFFADLGIPAPDINLEVGSGTHAEQTGRVMMAFEKVCQSHRPDWVVVVGDVNSTMACAITARKLGIRVAHVEAGLRSGDMTMPEEINRLCTDCIADLLFTTDELADANLRREGIPESRIRFVGNTMIDTLYRNLGRARSLPLPSGLQPGGFAVVTLHRPGNVDDPATLAGILDAVHYAADQIPVAFPVHPRTLKNIERFQIPNGHRQVHLMEPLSYLPFLRLVAASRLVLTDSGGIQEETTVLGVPCLTMRPNTERPITCTMGTNILVGNGPQRIRAAIDKALANTVPAHQVPPKWDGKAAERIVETLLDVLQPPAPEQINVGQALACAELQLRSD